MEKKIDTSQLLDSLDLIKKWNTTMLFLLDQCEKATESESIGLVDDLVRLCTSLSAELVVTNERSDTLARRAKALHSRRAALIRGRGMKSLPTELISHIFTYAVITHDNAALAITHVNSEWRRTALSTPNMWSTIYFKPNQARLAIYLERSKEVPLCIDFYSRTDEHQQATFPVLVTHCRRWREFSASVPDVAAAVKAIVDGLPDPPNLPVLEQFTIKLTYDSSTTRSSTLPFPPLRLPAIRRFYLYEPYRTAGFSHFGPGLECIRFCPSSLTGMESFLKLREFICDVQVDLVVEDTLQLHFPCLELVHLTTNHTAWAVVARIFRAMASCSPKKLNMTIDCQNDNGLDTGPTLDPPPTFLSRVEQLWVRVDSNGSCSQITRTNLAQILERAPLVRNLEISDVPEQHLLLRHVVGKLYPDLTSLLLGCYGDNANVIAQEVIVFLERRQENGMQPLKSLNLEQCGRPSYARVTRLRQLVDRVGLDGNGNDEDGDEDGDDEDEDGDDEDRDGGDGDGGDGDGGDGEDED